MKPTDGNADKSALVALLTTVDPEVADFPHTTWKPTPRMMPVENIQIKLVDISYSTASWLKTMPESIGAL
ncbi:hypothetical protein ACFL0M_16275 [Thermodesulfobacteriota bacterium]